MSPLRSSMETCLEKWAILFLEAGASGGVAMGLAEKLCKGLSSGVRSEGVVPLWYSSGQSPWVGDKTTWGYTEPIAERPCVSVDWVTQQGQLAGP